MKAKPEEMIGKRFGTNIVKQYLGSYKQCGLWLCECVVCGYQKKVTTGNLKHQLGCKKCNEPENKVGKKYLMLTVQEEVGKNKHNAKLYKCLCECGSTTVIPSHRLGRTISCGCITKRKKLDIGTRINMRTVIEQIDENTIRMKCDCGNEKIVSYSNFMDTRTISCGCVKGESIKKDIKGQRFGKLVALEESKIIRKKSENSTETQIFWKFKCDCGRIVEINKNNVMSGKQISCGCYRENNVQKTIGARTTFDHTNIHILTPEKRQPGKSGVVGVNKVGPDTYNARIFFQKKSYNLGNHDFDTAVALRKEAESKIFGDFRKWYEENEVRIKNGEIHKYTRE